MSQVPGAPQIPTEQAPVDDIIRDPVEAVEALRETGPAAQMMPMIGSANSIAG